MSAETIVAIARGLIEVLEQCGPSLARGALAERHEKLRVQASAFPSAEVLQRLEKATQALKDGQVDKAARRLAEARELLQRLEAKRARGQR